MRDNRKSVFSFRHGGCAEMADSTYQETALDLLNPRQRAFVAEYLLDLNATQAAIRAGYSPETAGPGAAQVLNNTKVAEAIAVGKAQRLATVNIKAETILSEIDALARSNVSHYVISDEGQVTLAEGAPRNAMSAVASIKRKTRVDKDGSVTYDVELKLWDKPGSLKLMGKHTGIKACFDRVELTGPDGGPIPIIAVHSLVFDVQPKLVGAGKAQDDQQ